MIIVRNTFDNVHCSPACRATVFLLDCWCEQLIILQIVSHYIYMMTQNSVSGYQPNQKTCVAMLIASLLVISKN